MNKLSIALLIVAVIVIAAWLAGWLPSWLASRLPESPLHEGFEAPPAAVDPMRPTEAETLAYLKYAVQLAVKPLDITEMNDFMDTISTPEWKKTYSYKRALQARAYYREVHVPRLVSKNLVDHPFYKAVMDSRSADELIDKIVAASALVGPRRPEISRDDMDALTDFMAAVSITPASEEEAKYHIGSASLPNFFKELLFYPLTYAATTICAGGGNPSTVFGADADAVCLQAKGWNSIEFAYGPYTTLYKNAATISAISGYITRIRAYVKANHASDFLYRIPPWAEYIRPKK